MAPRKPDQYRILHAQSGDYHNAERQMETLVRAHVERGWRLVGALVVYKDNGCFHYVREVEKSGEIAADLSPTPEAEQEPFRDSEGVLL